MSASAVTIGKYTRTEESNVNHVAATCFQKQSINLVTTQVDQNQFTAL
jgi:hypothetical protein